MYGYGRPQEDNIKMDLHGEAGIGLTWLRVKMAGAWGSIGGA